MAAATAACEQAADSDVLTNVHLLVSRAALQQCHAWRSQTPRRPLRLKLCGVVSS